MEYRNFLLIFKRNFSWFKYNLTIMIMIIIYYADYIRKEKLQYRESFINIKPK